MSERFWTILGIVLVPAAMSGAAVSAMVKDHEVMKTEYLALSNKNAILIEAVARRQAEIVGNDRVMAEALALLQTRCQERATENVALKERMGEVVTLLQGIGKELREHDRGVTGR